MQILGFYVYTFMYTFLLFPFCSLFLVADFICSQKKTHSMFFIFKIVLIVEILYFRIYLTAN